MFCCTFDCSFFLYFQGIKKQLTERDLLGPHKFAVQKQKTIELKSVQQKAVRYEIKSEEHNSHETNKKKIMCPIFPHDLGWYFGFLLCRLTFELVLCFSKTKLICCRNS